MSELDATIVDLLVERVGATPDKRFVRCGGVWRSYAEVFADSQRLAAGLVVRGVVPGTRVAVLLPNCHDFVTTIFACARLGAVQVPLNTSLKGDFLRYQLSHSEASVLVTDGLGLEQALDLLGDLPEIVDIILAGTSEPEVSLVGRRMCLFEEVMADGVSADVVFPNVMPADVSAVLYTSGTTGMPKGCIIPHNYRTNVPRAISSSGMFTASDTALTSWPLFHMGGQIVALGQALETGGSISIETWFSASQFLDQARDAQATVLMGMGMMAIAMLAQPPRDSDRTHSLRLGFFVPLSAEDHERFEHRFGIPAFSENYGQTEWNPIAFSPVSGPRRWGSAGRPLPDIEYRIVDDEDKPVEVGGVGEIVLRPARAGMMFGGYWNDPTATLSTFRNLWHHTGDFGRFDEAGFLYFVDRKKDAIRRRGELVSSQEVERAVLKHPDIAAVAVLAVPSEVTEDDIKACIVAVPGATLTPEGLFEFFRDALPYFAIPRYVELLDNLPVNASDRVVKHKLRESSARTWDLETMNLVVPRHERRMTAKAVQREKT